MEIKKATAQKAIRKGTAVLLSTVVDNGWRWQAVRRNDLQRIDHYRIERVA